jgi:hypothetical protein
MLLAGNGILSIEIGLGSGLAVEFGGSFPGLSWASSTKN